MPSKSKVYFFYEIPISLKNRVNLKKFIESIFKAEGRKLESLNYIFCSERKLLKINKEFLRHNYYTDIITFDLSGKNQPVIGEIYISVDRVRNNASMLKEPFNRELLRVIFHGALHLCGYGDKRHSEEKIIRDKEDFYISLFLKRST